MKHIIFRHYYQQTKVIIFFIDSSDEQQIMDSKQELQNIAKIKCLDKIPIIVFCNKQDLLSNDGIDGTDSVKSRVFSVEEIAEMIDLQNLLRVHHNGGDSNLSKPKSSKLNVSSNASNTTK